MKIRTLWYCNPKDPYSFPELLDSIDQYTEEAGCDVEECFAEAMRKRGALPEHCRELMIVVDEDVICNMFEPAETSGEIKNG